jgi:hypothetical protein
VEPENERIFFEKPADAEVDAKGDPPQSGAI